MPDHTDRVAVNTLRALAMDAVQAANSGHPGTPMALAPLGYLLFSRLLRHDPACPEWANRDRFVLSAGHASMLLYGLLHLSGYDLPLAEIRRFRQWGSRTPGHPERGHPPGVEVTTGPLGQGLGMAVGLAMAERHLAARFNRPGLPIIDHRTWVIASDGDLMEGVSGEASSLAGHLQLGKLVVFYDDNRITIDGGTDLAFSEDVAQRYAAYGWNTLTVGDGNDLDALERAVHHAGQDPRPALILVRTVIADPSPGKRGTSEAHGAPLGVDEVGRTKQVMGWPVEPLFHVPPEIAGLTEEIRARGRAARMEWELRHELYRRQQPAAAAELDAALRGELPAGWDAGLPQFPADQKGQATRKSGQTVLAELARRLPGLIGGSADLAASNLTYQKNLAGFHEREGIPRNVCFGIREHAMGAILNGMAAHGGVIPFGATFFVFSDYLRPAIRLAALMALPVRYVFTHDSIGLGEDGPTHQPVEHLAALRAMPGLTTIRPADANEVREAWVAALRRPGPVAIVLSRQNVPTLDRAGLGGAEGLHRGGYVLREAGGGTPDLILLATGSEVAIALAGADLLAAEGIRARVVNLPCWELFEEQDAAYRAAVLPPAVTRRVVVEAASRFGWERYAGPGGAFVTLDRFGASAPADVLYENFAITAAAVARAAKDVVRR